MWSRLRTRFAGFFSRNQHGGGESAGQNVVDAVAAIAIPLVEDTAVVAVSTPDDFKFPWTPRQPSQIAPDIGFTSVDEALPPLDDAQDALRDKRRSLENRSRAAAERSQLPDITLIGTHEERIDAAAGALQQAASDGEPVTSGGEAPGRFFANVDDALPSAGAPSTGVTGDEKTDEFEVVSADARRQTEGEEPTIELSPKRTWRQRLFGRFVRAPDGDITPAEPGALETTPAAGFLFAKFRAFYGEVIRFQHQKSEFTAGYATAMIADGEDPGPETAANALSRRLCELLELQAAEAKWMGGEAAERYPDAQYAMAALADEVFTYSAWEGQSAWPKYRLEQKIYRTHAAEVDVFVRIDTLLKDKPNTAVAQDLARVYLLVLAAGFLGKWRPFGLTRAVAEYRRRLYEYIHEGDALLLYASDRRVFPDAVSRTLEGHAVARFSAAQRWAAILAVLATTYFVVAHVAWTRSSSDLRDITARIKSLSPDTAP